MSKKVIISVKGTQCLEDGESDEDYDRRVSDFEDAWWSIPQPLLNQRNPDDAIREEMIRYGLNE